MTVEEFDRFTELPENANRLFEYIGGEIVEVPSKPYASQVSGIVFGEMYIFLKGKDLGHLTGEAGGYMVSGERYMPDVAFISKAKQPELAWHGYNPNSPDLAVEVHFSTTYMSAQDLNIKVANYLAAGTIVWVFKLQNKRVEVYAPGQPARILGVDGVLDGGEVLPGFMLAVKDIFAEEK